ncbi:hypothetical protein F5Y08DRAFT_320816 [Xylaria arbuscula]|nr:hypothetical protein F5Y08DRAFT_320816 [Xylaria arbuscula]
MSGIAKDRKKLSTVAERWYAIWEIMFPGIGPPLSPYIDASSEYDHLESRAKLNHFQQHNGLQSFLCSELEFNASRASVFAADTSNVLNRLLYYFTEWNPPSIPPEPHSVGNIHTTTTEPLWSQVSHFNVHHSTDRNTVSQTSMPSILAFDNLAAQAVQTEWARADWTSSNQGPNHNTSADSDESWPYGL